MNAALAGYPYPAFDGTTGKSHEFPERPMGKPHDRDGSGLVTRRRALAEASVELTPLIDVVLLLLIFFMVSTSFVRESRLGIELPGAAGEPRVMDSASVEILVNRDGAYRVNGKPVAGGSLPDLLSAIVEAGEGSRSGPGGLVIAADANSAHQAVVMALDAAGQAGLRHVSLLTQRRDDPAPQAPVPEDPGDEPAVDGAEPHAG